MLGSGPQHGIESTLTSEGGDDAAGGTVGQQPKRAIEAGLTCTVRSCDDIELTKRQTQIAQRPIVLDRNGGQHPLHSPASAVSSPAKASGSSQAVKWPPVGSSVQRTIGKKRSANCRGAGTKSFGKIVTPVGTVTWLFS